ncbi:MAG TPA: HEAT repeat domain-containing protein [Candidatus Ozemobacteraceae bacterium]|nr:HEAT repeat domain-containing protein [Candidatus Ozemobacteraceae bacterium]
MNTPGTQYIYRVVLPYSESSNPTKRFKIEYTIEATDRETAQQKAEREFHAYTLYNSASWVRTLERESIRVWRIMPNLPQTPQLIDDFAADLASPDQDVVYITLKALGELEDAAAGSKIVPLLDHENADLAALAAETLGKLGDPTNLPFLTSKYAPQTHPRLKASILSAIGRLARPGDPVAELVATALGDADNRVRANAVELVEHLKLPTTTRMLLPLMGDEDNRVRANVLKALWSTHDRRTLTSALQEMATHTSRWMRASAGFVLQHIDVQNRIALLTDLAHDPCPEVQSNAWKAILNIRELELLKLWLEYLVHHNGDGFSKICEHIDAIGQSAYLPLLELSRTNPTGKPFAVQFLDRLEELCRRNHGWLAWLSLKQQRIIGNLF